MNALTVVPFFIIIVLNIAAVKTVIPNLNASKLCLLGYRATCSFTPLSTAFLVIAAIATFVIAKRLYLI
jgi:hypothetical protein